MKSEYAKAGVDVEAGYDTVSRIKSFVGKTFDENVLSGLGSFGGFYAIPGATKMTEPVLIAGTDGVGTKLRIAFILDKHDTIGIDCVAMCVNDIICQGAKPLFFLDYLATGKLIPEKAAQIVKGVADGCIQAGCALIGGETAEMPGFYGDDEYDLAGFAVGLADKANVVDGSAIKDGDILIGLASSGAHSNGFSLIRKVFPMTKEALDQYIPELGEKLGAALLTPTRIYVKAILSAMEKVHLHGIANITGGGFIENVPRIIPEGLCANIELIKCHTPPLFDLIRKAGNLEPMGMYNVFNMGISMVVAVDEADVDAAVRAFAAAGETAHIIGHVTRDDEKVKLL